MFFFKSREIHAIFFDFLFEYFSRDKNLIKNSREIHVKNSLTLTWFSRESFFNILFKWKLHEFIM